MLRRCLRPGARLTMPTPHFNIADLFEIVADTVPEREALVCGEERRTYAELDRRATRLANFLAARGVGAGDKVGLYLYNCNAYLEGMLACFKIRAVPVNVNFRYTGEELSYIFTNADMVACIHHREFGPRIAAVRADAPMLRLLVTVEDGSADPLCADATGYEDAVAAGSAERNFAERSDDDLFILYTGGTTGMPKGVMWPHKAVFFAAMGGGGHFHPAGPIREPADIAVRAREGYAITGIALAPLMHGACWWYACIQLLAGGKVVLNPSRSLDGAEVWDIVQREKVNAISIVGDAMAIPLLEALKANPGRWDLSSVFNVGSGGAVFSESKQAEFKAHFPNVFITNSFGSSESGQMGMDSGQRKDGAQGTGLGNVAKSDYMSVIVEDERRHALPGEMGIFARAGHIPVGYYNDPVKTAKTIVEVENCKWLLTGDAARLEEDGSISVFGRGSNCINSGGEKIFPEEVEQAMKSHPEVLDVLVVATPDERWGQKVTAVVAARGGARPTLESLQQEVRRHLAGYKVPRELHLVAEVPRGPNGKPDYKAAREIALAGAHRA
jgi:acyl-CoA synthetase (AMP-forming)/AMP-acid ligase II